MSRVLFAKGAIGEIIRKMQARLGLPAPDVDGWFGDQTRGAVADFQTSRGLSRSGEVDVETWTGLMAEPVPELRDRSLQLTAHFEGHGFGLAQGNFDGAGITWGIIGFTLKGGELGAIVLEAQQRSPALLEQAFGTLAPDLLDVVKRSWDEQLAFAGSITLGQNGSRLTEPWLTSFRRFGELPDVQALQLARARTDYYEPARVTASKLGLTSELGVALAFDIHVQNGGIKKAARDQITQALQGRPAPSESELRVIIANAVADFAKVKWREDVRARKLAIATGSGSVHGRSVVLRNWGLDELPA